MTSRTTKLATLVAGTAMGLAGFAGLAVPAGAAPSAAASPAPAACDRAPWEARVQGAPRGFSAGSPSGDYLWHSSTGFHLRVTHGKNHDQRVYSGEITSSSAIRIDPVKLERGDVVKRSADHRSLLFVFANHGYVDGVNFHTDCAKSLIVSHLHVGSSNLSTHQVYLGYTRAHPARIPFTVHRYSSPA